MRPFLFLFLSISSMAVGKIRQEKLETLYQSCCAIPSDINEHIPILRDLARESNSIVEIGVRSMVSTWGILKGLSENGSQNRSYLGIDLESPPVQKLNLARKLTENQGISFGFWQTDDMLIDIPPADMLFIDSLHTYCHLTYELEKFSPQIAKVICLHDTSEPYGETDELDYRGNRSEYPAFIDRDKRGLWKAVEDFLVRHPEWRLAERRTNNHGFTILRRS